MYVYLYEHMLTCFCVNVCVCVSVSFCPRPFVLMFASVSQAIYSKKAA